MLILGIFAAIISFISLPCAIMWLLPSQIAKIIRPAKTSYGTIDRHKESKLAPIKIAFTIMSMIGWSVIYSAGLYGLLWFLLEDWGTQNEYGEWNSYRAGISGSIGLFLSLFTLAQLEKLNLAYLSFIDKKHQ